MPNPGRARGVFKGGFCFARGANVGPDLSCVDVYAAVQAGEMVTIDTDAPADVNAAARAPVVRTTNGPLRTPPAINGVAMVFLGATSDGAFLRGRYRLRVGPLLVVDLVVLWCNGDPFLTGSVTLTASNASVPDMSQTVAGGLRLTWGDAVVGVYGAQPNGVLLDADTVFADGMSRIVPVVVAWLGDVRTNEELATALVLADRALVTSGGVKLYPEGNPRIAPSFNPDAFLATVPEARRRLHTWDGALLGPNKRPADTGSQEDQVVHGEAIAFPDCGLVNYLAALKWANHPCHLREWDGSFVTAANHPRTMLWVGRAHRAAPDTLGKPRELTVDEAFGWVGFDDEHWLIGRLFEEVRRSGDLALQDELVQHAHSFLLAMSLPIGEKAHWFTSQPGAARAVGWKALVAHRLFYALEDRDLAEQVRKRWSDVLRFILIPAYGANVDIWDVRTDDPRLGPGRWWLPWQQAVGAYGVMLASLALADEDIRQAGVNIAHLAAQAVLRDGFVKRDGVWVTYAQRPVGASTTEPDASFNHFGMPLAIAAILTHAPEHAEARDVWKYLLDTATTQDKLRWMVPLPGESQ